MTTYFNPDDMAFYSSELYSNIPSQAVPLSDEQYIALLNGQSQGKQIIADKTGNPVLIDPQPSAAHELNLDTLTWEISGEKQTALFAETQSRLIANIDEHAAKIYSTWTRFESEYRERQAAGLEKLQMELANQRMRKYELKAPNLTLEQLQSIHDDIIKQMDSLMEAYQNG